MKKILIVILITTLLCLIPCSCSIYKDYVSPEREKNKSSDSSMFVIIEETMNYKIVYHKNTKVMYTISWGGYNSGDFTLLVNADGTPMIFKGE